MQILLPYPLNLKVPYSHSCSTLFPNSIYLPLAYFTWGFPGAIKINGLLCDTYPWLCMLVENVTKFDGYYTAENS